MCVCVQWLTKAGDERDLKDVIDIKSGILAVLEKHKKINVAMSATSPRKTASPPHTFTPPPPNDPQPSTSAEVDHTPSSSESLYSRQLELEQDPTTIQAQLGALHRKKYV